MWLVGVLGCHRWVPPDPRPAPLSPGVVIDTDLSLWWDDATALGIANVLHDRGELRLLGIVSDVPNRVAVAAIDAIDTAYGHPDVPIGAVDGSDADTFDHGYTDALVDQLPHALADSSDAPSAVDVYRAVLDQEPDHSVTVLAIGGYTNLAALLRSDRALVAAKVDRIVIEDGLFPCSPSCGPLTNQQIDPDAAQEVLADDGWPTPIAWVDGQNGITALVGGTLCATVPADDPMRIVYEALFGCGPPTDGDWDGPTVLYAVDGAGTAFTELGQGGSAVLDPAGGLTWQTPSSRPDDLYVHTVDGTAVNERLEELLTAR